MRLVSSAHSRIAGPAQCTTPEPQSVFGHQTLPTRPSVAVSRFRPYLTVFLLLDYKTQPVGQFLFNTAAEQASFERARLSELSQFENLLLTSTTSPSQACAAQRTIPRHYVVNGSAAAYCYVRRPGTRTITSSSWEFSEIRMCPV